MITETLRCALVRGGTSKGIVVNSGNLPSEQHDKAILSIFGSYEPRQVDGLGGATSTTSKLIIVSASPRPNIDAEYTFGQVGVDKPVIDYGGNCGNMTTAVGPFAYEEELANVSPDQDGRVSMSLYNTNTDTRIEQSFPVSEQRVATEGEFSIHGVPGEGARVDTTFCNPSGSRTKSLLPLGEPTVDLETQFEEIEATVMDVTTPVAFVRASDLGLSGTEHPNEIDSNKALLERIEAIRARACVKLGFVDNPTDADTESPGFPKLAFVSEPQTYETAQNRVGADEINITARIMSMQFLHPIYAVTGAACTAAATLMSDTIPNEVGNPDGREVTIGHPQGTMTVSADVEDNVVRSVTVSRTQRRLMDGQAYYTLDSMR